MAGRKVRDKEELLHAIICQMEKEAGNKAESVEKKVLEPNVPLAALAREANAQSGILSEFTDSELESLLTVEFDIKPMYYGKCQSLYKSWIKNYDNLKNIRSLVCYQKVRPDYDCRSDYDHAVEYAKGDVLQELEAIWTGVTDWIKGKIEEEKQIPAKWQEEQEKKGVEIKAAISGWIQESAENIASQKVKAEADYERRLEEWKQAKATYQAQYEAAVAKQLNLQEKIVQLEQEKAQLKGLFTKRKKEELGTKISMLNVSLKAMTLPQDPGEPPVKEHEKIQIAKAIFPVFRELQSLREELARTAVGKKCISENIFKIKTEVSKKFNGVFLTRKKIPCYCLRNME